jgi:uncharacterized protein YjbI with pentapeptide repeats
MERDTQALRLVPATALDHPTSQRFAGTCAGDTQRPRFDLGGQTVTGLRVRDALLVGSVFLDAELHRVQVVDTVMNDSDLRAAVFDTADLHRVTFRGCRMTAAIFTRSHLRTVRFERCTLVGASFVHNTLDAVTFAGCTLADAEFHPDDASACRFAGCDLSRLNVVGDVCRR